MHSENENKYFFVPIILSCGNHLQFGYVDHPAITPLLTRISLIFSKSLTALRFFPALAGSLTMLITALISRELGGSRFAAALSSILFGIVFRTIFGVMSVNAFDILFVTRTSSSTLEQTENL